MIPKKQDIQDLEQDIQSEKFEITANWEQPTNLPQTHTNSIPHSYKI